MSTQNKNDFYYKAFAFSVLIVVGFVVFQFLAVLAMNFLSPENSISIQSNFQLEHLVFIAWFNFICFVPMALFFFLGVDKQNFREIGFSVKYTEILFFSLLGVLIVVVLFGIYIQSLSQFNFIHVGQEKPSKILLMLLFGLLSGFSEEIVYRGYLLKLFVRKGKNLTGVIWTAILFTLLHVFNPEINQIALLNIFLIGVFLALATIHTKSLYLPILFHASFNFLDVFLGFNFILTDGNISWLKVEFLKSNDLVTGGKGGITGSLILTGLLLLCIAVIIVIVRLLNKKKNRSFNNIEL